jgi:hypothetical protein
MNDEFDKEIREEKQRATTTTGSYGWSTLSKLQVVHLGTYQRMMICHQSSQKAKFLVISSH